MKNRLLTMVVGTALFFGGFSFVHAQSLNIISQQGVLLNQATVNDFASAGGGLFDALWDIQLGNGFVGTSTANFMSVSYSWDKTQVTSPTRFDLQRFPSSAYSGTPEQDCTYLPDLSGGNYPLAGASFLQLLPTNCETVFNPTKFYRLEITQYHSAGHIDNVIVRGIASTTKFITTSNYVDTVFPNFVPQFVVTGGGFTITPSASSTGLSSISGAQAFCNSIFASSTSSSVNDGNVITNFGAGIIANALCIVGGFLFIPSSDSVNQFTSFTNSIQGKFPFSWGFQIRDLFASLTASSTANYPTIGYNLANMASTSPLQQSILGSSVSIANPTTIQNLAPDSTWTFIRLLMSYMLYIAFAYFVYRKVIGIWHVQT